LKADNQNQEGEQVKTDRWGWTCQKCKGFATHNPCEHCGHDYKDDKEQVSAGQKHHITVKGIPLCEAPGLNTTDVYCNHLTRRRAKAALLRLMEQNPMFSACHYAIKPGVCDAINAVGVGE
jgi:hypothetical protein